MKQMQYYLCNVIRTRRVRAARTSNLQCLLVEGDAIAPGAVEGEESWSTRQDMRRRRPGCHPPLLRSLLHCCYKLKEVMESDRISQNVATQSVWSYI